MRILLGVMLVAAALLAGCATLTSTPYNPQEACDAVGGTLTADGNCLAGND